MTDHDPVAPTTPASPRDRQTAAYVIELTEAKKACLRILVKLQPLSDKRASTIRTDGRLTRPDHGDKLRTREHHPMSVKSPRFADSTIPEGVTSKLGGSHAPSKQLSLYAHYKYRMTAALQMEDAGRVYRLVGEATKDYEEHIGTRRPLRFEHHDQAVDYLLREFVGVPAETVAIEMRTPNESFRDALRWVHRQRATNGRDPELGELRQNDERTQTILKLSAQGWKQQMIADHLGLSRQRIQQLLAGR